MRALFWVVFCAMVAIAQESGESAKKVLEGINENNQVFPFEMAKSPLEGINLLQYSGVILILVGLLVLLWYVRKRVYCKEPSNVLLDFFRKKEEDCMVKILSITSLSPNNKLVIFEVYKMRYIVVLSQNGVILVDKYPLEDFGELLKQEKQ